MEFVQGMMFALQARPKHRALVIVPIHVEQTIVVLIHAVILVGRVLEHRHAATRPEVRAHVGSCEELKYA